MIELIVLWVGLIIAYCAVDVLCVWLEYKYKEKDDWRKEAKRRVINMGISLGLAMCFSIPTTFILTHFLPTLSFWKTLLIIAIIVLPPYYIVNKKLEIKKVKG